MRHNLAIYEGKEPCPMTKDRRKTKNSPLSPLRRTFITDIASDYNVFTLPCRAANQFFI